MDLKAVSMMIVVQVAYAGVSILYKLVASEGTSLCILMAYRFLFASAFMVPLAFLVERKRKPKITGKVLFEAFMCGFFGASLQQNLFVEAVALAGATYPTAMYNLIPGSTFILAVCFRFEKINIRTITGKAKVIGTLTGIGGAMVMTFYKGIELQLWSTHLKLVGPIPSQSVSPATQIWGILLALGTCISYSIWLIIQAKMSENFPWSYTSAALMSVMASIQSVIFALCIERHHWNRWRLGLDITLFTAAYTGIVASGIAWVLITWCVQLKGPVYTSVFSPLFLIIVAIVGSLVLDERLHLGSIIGSILIVLGLYTVLWGKAKELKKDSDHQSEAKDSPEENSVEIIAINHRKHGN